MSELFRNPLSQNIADASACVFGQGPTTYAIHDACRRYDVEFSNITAARGIHAILIAIVGAKGQGKTWVARQLVLNDSIKSQLRSGDLIDDATTRLVWIGPHRPDELDPNNEIYHPCPSAAMVNLGREYVLLDTPGSTDADPQAASVAANALSLAPIKLLVIARDQMRSAASMQIAQRIDGSVCIPVISSVEAEELIHGSPAHRQLESDLLSLRSQILSLAPNVRLETELLVPDFEISGDEAASTKTFVTELTSRIASLKLDDLTLANSRDQRLASAERRLRAAVSKAIASQAPQLSAAVDRLNRETESLPERVLDSLLGSSKILETGVRMRLRSTLVGDTYLLWFPYRTLMSTLNLTQGAWDRVMLAMAGSVPSLFGALASWARNVRQTKEFSFEVQDGIRERMRRQVEERLKPLCEEFHRAVLRLRANESAEEPKVGNSAMTLSGIEELQSRSREIFDSALARFATPNWVVQVLGIVGVLLFWSFMAGPVVSIYHQYFSASYDSLVKGTIHSDGFPHPAPSLIFTSIVLSLLPLMVYGMLVLTFALSNRKIRHVTNVIQREHENAIRELRANRIIQLQFEDRMLQQAQYLINLAQDK